jgi:hypothetical protein
MDDFKTCRLDDAPAAAIFVVETIENAQPAEAAGTCLRFYNRKRKGGEKGLFAGKLRYAVLGLGDTNLLLDRQSTTAKDCNQSAQTLDSALKFLGADQMCTRGEANDAVGLEEAVEPWCEKLWAPLAKAMKEVDGGAAAGNGGGGGGGGGVTVNFIYGSQTGNATEICKAMAAEAPAKGFTAKCNAANEMDVKDLLSPGAVVVYVVSSTVRFALLFILSVRVCVRASLSSHFLSALLPLACSCAVTTNSLMETSLAEPFFDEKTACGFSERTPLSSRTPRVCCENQKQSNFIKICGV